MNLLAEITSLSDDYWKGRISVETYYRLCDLLVKEYQIDRLLSEQSNSTGIEKGQENAR